MPDQVTKFWDVIKYAIEESIPPIATNNVNLLNNILMSILSNKTQCWASYEKNEKGNRFEGIMLTQVVCEEASNTKNLLIYAMYGFDPVSSKSWKDGLEATVKFAKSQGCRQIVGYTDLNNLVELAKKLGGSSRHFISFNIDEIVKKFNNLI